MDPGSVWRERASEEGGLGLRQLLVLRFCHGDRQPEHLLEAGILFLTSVSPKAGSGNGWLRAKCFTSSRLSLHSCKTGTYPSKGCGE